MQTIDAATPANSRVWRFIHFPPVLLAIAVVFVFAAGALSSAVAFVVGQHLQDWRAVALAIVVAGIFVSAYWLFERLIERRPAVEFGLSGWAAELGGGVLAGLVLFSCVVAVIAALGGYHVAGTRGPAVLYAMAAVAITSGVTEEIMFRGFFFRLVESWLGSWAALVLSAALFGAAHLANPNATPLAAVAIALEAGIMLAALYMITRRLWAVIGLHAAWNFAQGGIYGISISGTGASGLLRPRMTGPDLLTGGAFGAEASLPAIVVATAFGIALLVVAWRRGRFVAPLWVRRRAAQPAALQA